MKRLFICASIALLVAPAGGLLDEAHAAALPTTYYVDCATGSDTAVGTAVNAAWKTLRRANLAELAPGDRLLLRRDCTFTNERIDARWNGTAAAPVLIGAYGSGNTPLVLNGMNQGVKITGSWQIVENLRVLDIPEVTIVCNQPIGSDYGVNFLAGSHHNLVRGLSVSGYQAGIRVGRDSYSNRILNNVLTENGMLNGFHEDPSTDLGARGIMILGDSNEVGFNMLRNNRAKCSNRGYKLQSNSIEIFEGRDNIIHHNRSYGDRVFSEVGGSDGDEATGNTWGYNLMTSDLADSRFLVTRGGGHVFGPTSNSMAVHNTVYLNGPGSEAVSCGGSCDSSVLSLHSNILWAESRVLYADGAIDEGENIFWNSTGTPRIDVRVSMPTTSVIANPLFANPARGNFRIWRVSPATDRAADLAAMVTAARLSLVGQYFDTDLAGMPVPQNGVRDIGGFEWWQRH